VVVTSRSRLPGLVTGHGAGHLALDVLSDDEARALLVDRLGAHRVRAEPVATSRLIELCGGYPLALSIIAGRAHTSPDLTLAGLAEELHELGLDALDDDDPAASVPAVLSWSQRALTADQSRAFALLGSAPGPDIGLPAAACLIGLPETETRKVLRALEQASLLTLDDGGRHRMHDLVRRHAAGLDEQGREAGLRRVLDFYAHTAHAAERVMNPDRPPVEPVPPEPGVRLHPIADDPGAMAWFDAERHTLLAAQQVAAAHHRHHTAWLIAWAVTEYLQRRGHLHDQVTVWRTAVDAAAHLDSAAGILAHRLLGRSYAYLMRHEDAIRHLHRALALADLQDDLANQAHTHQGLARAWERRGDNRRALDHATRALHLYRTLGEPLGEANALSAVGQLAAWLGEYDTARDHCQAALAAYRGHNALEGEADNLDVLGWIDHHTGRYAEAVERHRRALAVYRRIGHATRAAHTLDHLGHPLAALGRHDQARAVWREALDLYRQQGRDEEAERLRRQLAALDPSRPTEPAR
jgi:tetratricopeptide (TPR) repeat protein